MLLGSIAYLFPVAYAQSPNSHCHIEKVARGVHLSNPAGTLELELLEPNVVRIDAEPHEDRSPRTAVLDPELSPGPDFPNTVRIEGDSASIETGVMRVHLTCSPDLAIEVADAHGHTLLRHIHPLVSARSHRAMFLHYPSENLYGMSGISMRENGGSLLRNNGSVVRAGQQGEGGAPWFFTTRYGVLIDSKDGTFNTQDDSIEFEGISRQDCEYFVMVGQPLEVMSALAKISGLPPMPPKWTLGFLNSQWGATEAEMNQIAQTYRAKHIPLDAFILDFDWKAWGEDHYGEWRWNSTSGAGNVHPDEFPDGASGLFAKNLRSQGIRLAGILKPRIILNRPKPSVAMDEAASYAEQHKLWYPGEPPIIDYFSNRRGRDLDFSNPDTRSWYWQHLRGAFNTGLVGWWNDEADVTSSADGREFYFDSFQFLNMGRMLFDGQRKDSDLRVWSINRNYYLGAQRYGYAEWSGDIQTGFRSMAHQRMRMLATLDLGEPHWSMDAGGFFGHPSPENYARWIEFAAFVPITRVHGMLGEKRQPWVYGPVAEAAATRALRLRYELLPYIYSNERVASETGVGIVRPLFWMFPDDPAAADDGSSWMFGDAFLVSPVVTAGESTHAVYLPRGKWYDFLRGTAFSGGQVIHEAVDPDRWQDIPLFVRAGSIVVSQPPQDYTEEHPEHEITVDIFPGSQAAQFTYYDDDGETYAYERGAYYRQVIHATQAGAEIHVEFDSASGSYRPALTTFLVRIHGSEAHGVSLNGKSLSQASSDGAGTAPAEGQWSSEHDRFGPSTVVRIGAAGASTLILQ